MNSLRNHKDSSLSIIELQALLKYLYKEVYKDDLIIQANLLDLGESVKQLLNDKRISPFDDYDKVKEQIYNNMRTDYVDRYII